MCFAERVDSVVSLLTAHFVDEHMGGTNQQLHLLGTSQKTK